MAIIQTPDDVELATINCALCNRELAPCDATAGLVTADNCQAFAHTAHVRGRHEYIVGWARFNISERKKLEGLHMAAEFDEDSDNAFALH